MHRPLFFNTRQKQICKTRFILLFTFLFFPFYFLQAQPLCFKENKGQVQDQDHNGRPDIFYMVKAAPGLSIFIGNGEIHYQFCKTIHPANMGLAPDMQNPKNLIADPKLMAKKGMIRTKFGYIDPRDSNNRETDSMYRMDVTLVGHNPHAQIIADEPLDYTEHYYTPGTCQDDATVYTCQKITFKDIYPI